MSEMRSTHPVHAELLGAVIIAWSNVSHCLEELFTHLADLDDAFVTGVFIEKIRDAQLDDVVSSLAGRLEEDSRDAVRDWIREVKKVRVQRNRYLHGVYLPFRHSDGVDHLYVLGKRALDRSTGTARPELSKLLSIELADLRDQMLEIRNRYDRLLDEHFPFPVRQISEGPTDD